MAAQMIGITNGRIYQLIKSGEMATIPLGDLKKYGVEPSLTQSKHYFTRSEVEKFMQKERKSGILG
jgi:hypothetical protein